MAVIRRSGRKNSTSTSATLGMKVLSGDSTLPQLILPEDVSAPSTRPEKNTICQPNRLNETRSP
ncbi:hypothetical protein D3C87_1710680 [compost metagenome]